MKKMSGSTVGISFHDVVIKTTPHKMIAVAEKLDAEFWEGNDGSDKSNFDFEFETEEGDFFTVYDWKEYRRLNMHEDVIFNIGAENKSVSYQAKRELQKELNSL